MRSRSRVQHGHLQLPMQVTARTHRSVAEVDCDEVHCEPKADVELRVELHATAPVSLTVVVRARAVMVGPGDEGGGINLYHDVGDLLVMSMVAYD